MTKSAIRFFIALFTLATPLFPVFAEVKTVAKVNSEAISSEAVEQRQRFLAVSSGMGEEMNARLKALVKSPDVQTLYKEFAQKRVAQAQQTGEQLTREGLQREFIEQLKQRVQRDVLSSKMNAASTRKQAIEELIDEKLKLQDAKENGIVVSDEDVMQQFISKTEDGKTVNKAEEIFAQLARSGVNRRTFIERRRAQMAWAMLIRRRFSFRIQNAAASETETTETDTGKMVYDLRVLRIAAPSGTDQRALGRLWTSADRLRQRFSSCAALEKDAKLINASLSKQTSLDRFAPEARAMIVKASASQMTPPVIVKDAIEAYAVCSKKAAPASGDAKKGGAKAPDKADKRQEEYEIQARGHLASLRKKALIEYY